MTFKNKQGKRKVFELPLLDFNYFTEDDVITTSSIFDGEGHDPILGEEDNLSMYN